MPSGFDILNLGQHSFVVQHDDRPPLAMVNRVGLPWPHYIFF